MLHLCYLGEAKKLHIEDNSLKLFIVRKPMAKIPNGFIHVPHLSPSLELFKDTQRWKKGDFTLEEIIVLKQMNVYYTQTDLWWYLYKERFEKELTSRKDMIKALERLKVVLNEGKEVYLFCFCKNLYRCHRYLIGKYFESLGFEVDFGDRSK